VRVLYSVTFEFAERPPTTHRGMVVASSGATCVARATREAQKALKPVNWSSVVCVLLERLPEAAKARRRDQGEGATTDSGNMGYPPG
jgi:hypothetical protein